MYTYKDRIKAVKLLIKYDMNCSDTTRTLGYPSRKTFQNWYKEYGKMVAFIRSILRKQVLKKR